MGIASYSGASSVIKPGVVTSSTRPSSPFVGQLIYDTTVSQALAWNGSAWVIQNGGWVYVTGASFTSATTISMAAGVFTSTYKTYQIVFTGTSAAGDGQLSVRVNNAGTPRTAGSYYGSSQRFPYVGTNPQISLSSGTTSLNIGAFTATYNIMPQYIFTLNEPTNAALKTQISATGTGVDNSNSTAVILAGGAYNTAEATDGLTWIAGQAVTGYYRVYGLTEN
jgi:hypothetical protein